MQQAAHQMPTLAEEIGGVFSEMDISELGDLLANLGVSFSDFEGGFFRGCFAAADLFVRVHCPPALLRSAAAQGFIVPAIIEAVVVSDLLAGGDVADGRDPDPTPLFARSRSWRRNCG